MQTVLGFSPFDFGAVLAGLAALTMCGALWAATTVRNPMRGRLENLIARREQLKAGISVSRKRTKIDTNARASFMRHVVDKFKLAQSEQVRQATAQLARAGYRHKDAVIALQFSRLISPLCFAALGATLIYGLGIMGDYSSNVKALAAIGFVFLGYKAPDLFVNNAAKKRDDAIRKGLPDALDLLVICAEAGLTVDASFTRAARELGLAYPELADEMGLTAIELGFLQDRRQALQNLMQRVTLPAVRGVVTTLIQTEKYGTPLASSLRVLSAEFRNERMMKAEEKAARLPAIMTVPLILFILPTLFIVILGPASCSISDNVINR